MAEFPALPLFTDAYIADTRHLSAAQHGAYLLLLMMAWRQPDCSIPDDDKVLARWASMDNRTWKANKEIILSFWKLGDDQKFRQHRLLDERKYVDDLRNKNAAAGRSSALKRLNRGSTSVPTKPQPKSNPHTHTHREDKSSLPPTPKTVFPDWLPEQDWKDYLEMRKKIRKTPTDRAMSLALAKLSRFRAAGHDVGVILQQSTLSCWTDLYEPKIQNSQTKGLTKHERVKIALDRAEQELRDEREQGERLALTDRTKL